MTVLFAKKVLHRRLTDLHRPLKRLVDVQYECNV